MNYKLTVPVGNSRKTFFLQKGFYTHKTTVSPIHKHYYTEIHIVSEGNISYTLGKKTLVLEGGGILAIPPNTLHSCTSIDGAPAHCAFLIDASLKSPRLVTLSPDTIKDFFNEIKKASETDNYSVISGFLCLMYNALFENESVKAEKIEDYSFIIEEFLKVNYSRNIKLADLAAELNLSEKHTERLVKKFTGNTFKQELAGIRIKTAQMLLSSTKMTMTEISEYVGYDSYSGFYKAYKKHLQ